MSDENRLGFNHDQLVTLANWLKIKIQKKKKLLINEHK
jgi:hypothetical protein